MMCNKYVLAHLIHTGIELCYLVQDLVAIILRTSKKLEPFLQVQNSSDEIKIIISKVKIINHETDVFNTFKLRVIFISGTPRVCM